MDGHTIILKTVDDWKQQVEAAMETIREKNGGTDPVNLAAGHDVDPEAFGRLIEALVALRFDVADDMIRLAGLRPVDEVLLG